MKNITPYSNIISFYGAGFPAVRYFSFFVAMFIPVLLSLGVSVGKTTEITYDIAFEGLDDRGIEFKLRGISDMEELRDKPPAGIGLLRSRAERDRKKFIEYLRSRGWYSAEIGVRVDRDLIPIMVTFDVDIGPPYLLKDVHIQAVEEAADLKMPSAEELDLVPGKRFEAKALLSAQKKLLADLKRRGRPFPSVVDRRVVVNHLDHTVSVEMPVDPGRIALLGEPCIEGLEFIEESFVRKMIPWKPGDLYDPARLQAFHRELSLTGLFAGIKISEGAQVDEEGVLPVTISLTERKHRSVGAALTYASDEGPGVKLSWEHRNVLHHGERLGMSASGSASIRDVSAGFRRPFFLRDDQSLSINARFADDRPDAYESRNLTGSLKVERKLGHCVTAGWGLGYKKSRITQFGSVDYYQLLFLPLALSFDTSDDLLEPRKGGRFTVETTPMLDISDSNSDFVKLYGKYRRYLPLSDLPSIVAAGSITAGVISGARQKDVPADERFYAGGGGSIRGYSYQSVGPLVGDIPYGGRSLLECSFEIRAAVTDSIGIVGFLDGGTAYESGDFRSGEAFRWGSGLGLRYRTPVGPLRLDVAVPLNRRHGIDDSFQFYLSLRQAF